VTSTWPRPSVELLPPELAAERILWPSLPIPPGSPPRFRQSASRFAGRDTKEPAHGVRRVPGGDGHPRRLTGRSRVRIGKWTRALQRGRATLLSGEADPGDRLSLKGSVDLARATCTARDGWLLSLRPWGREWTLPGTIRQRLMRLPIHNYKKPTAPSLRTRLERA
jgi:hypothetical protein